jgi:hypothetical protein
MSQVQPTTNESVRNESEVFRQQPLAQTPIDRILQKLCRMELLAKEHFERAETYTVTPNPAYCADGFSRPFPNHISFHPWPTPPLTSTNRFAADSFDDPQPNPASPAQPSGKALS